MRVSDLMEQRTKIATAMRALHAEADASGDLPSETQKKFDQMKTELESVEQRMQRQALIDDLDRRTAGTPIRTAGSSEFDRELRSFSLCKLIASSFDGSVDAAREREICQEQRTRTGRRGDGFLVPFEALVPERRMETRVLTVAGDGANLVSEQFGDFIDALRPASVATRLGARVVTGLVSDIALPKRDARTPTAAWFVENDTITSADQSFAQVTGSPKHLGLITEFGRKTMLQSTPGIEQLTRQHLIEELAVGLDLGVMKGSGAAGQPTGITQTGSINTLDNSGGAPDYADVLSVIAQVEAADVPAGSFGFALNAYLKATLLEITKVSSDAGAGFLMEANGTILQIPAAVTSQLAGVSGASPSNGEAIFGAWNQVIVAMWSGVEILVNPYESTAYSKGNVSVRGIVDADVLVRHPQAFTHWFGIDVS